VTPVGVFVRIVDGIAGLLRFDELTAVPSIGDEIAVVVCGIDRARVRLRPTASSGSPGG
jgi:ribosomal protein S1